MSDKPLDLTSFLRVHPDKATPQEWNPGSKYVAPQRSRRHQGNNAPDADMGPDVTHRCTVCGAPFLAKYGVPETCSGMGKYVSEEYSDGLTEHVMEDSTHDPAPLRPLDRSITTPLILPIFP